MSNNILIVKGFPIQFNVGVTDANNNVVDINDGTWSTTVELHYQSKTGAQPFSITPTINGNAVQVNLDGTQTSQLDHLGTGYILVIRAQKIDQTTFLKTHIQVDVKDDL